MSWVTSSVTRQNRTRLPWPQAATVVPHGR
jgi:hypothetical protein